MTRTNDDSNDDNHILTNGKTVRNVNTRSTRFDAKRTALVRDLTLSLLLTHHLIIATSGFSIGGMASNGSMRYAFTSFIIAFALIASQPNEVSKQTQRFFSKRPSLFGQSTAENIQQINVNGRNKL